MSPMRSCAATEGPAISPRTGAIRSTFIPFLGARFNLVQGGGAGESGFLASRDGSSRRLRFPDIVESWVVYFLHSASART
jgi:hypothetical protein